jgi:molybdopterin synthase sulfur carrier subunit
MLITILSFGIAKEIFGASSIDIELPEGATTKDLKFFLEEKYPRLRALASYMIAIDNEYSVDNQILSSKNEVAIIPPVSGG